MDSIDLSPSQRKTVVSLLNRYIPGITVWAYGSRVKWTSRPDSDLDLAVFAAPEQQGRISSLKEAFEESSLPFRVDVMRWDEVPDNFRKNILEQYVMLVEKPEKLENQAGKGEWKVLSLEDCMSAIIDYRGKTPQKTSSGIPLVTAKVVKGGRIETPDEFIAIEDFESWMRRGMPMAGDVVMTTEAPLGEIAQLGPERVALAQRLITLRGKPDILDNTFLKFLMQSSEVQDQLHARASGTTVLGIKQSELRKINLTLPPLPEQRAIAHILGTLDDKIELNRRMNETLEAMARALFKSWFVDFDPVRAKVEGRDTGLPNEIADLFPDSFEGSELGEVPKGWRVRSFAETVEIIGGGTPKTSVAEYWNGDIPWFSVVDAPDDTDVFVIDTQKMITQTGLEGSSARFLPEGSTIITARGTVGKVALVGVPMAMNQSCYALRSLDGSHFFGYYSTRALVETLKQRSHGSVFDTITRDTLAGIKTITPSEPVKRAFEAKVKPFLHRIKANIMESRTLAAQRDTLLPKLLSGEVRVK
ncbi:MAG: restriction endonuclease subunit S [Deltaproteobacteria bacterium]|nr:restriction endonuclease subunit S [Deltaproteobacteria bacterium]